MNVTEMVCIVCPNGCHLKVSRDGDTIDVQGAKCKRGIAFGTTELTNPTRSLTTTVDTAFPDMPRLPVKTNGEIPKERLLDAMKIIRAFKLDKCANTGDVIIKDVFGADIVATSDMN